MCIRYLGFALLIWFPGVPHAQDATQSCVAPRLDGGFFSPRQDTYSHGTKMTYTCENGRKPTVNGWWATSTCQNSKWSHEPQCIDEKACFAPTIPNANYTKNQDGWYQDGNKIRITCDRGYEPKNNDATAKCTNGAWSSVPVCEKSTLACGEPPQIPHAVIIHQGYQEVFAADSEVQYECKEGYTVDGAENKKSIFCKSGNWTEGPPCSRGTGAGTGSTVEGTARETTPSTGGTSHSGTPSTGGGSSTGSVLNGRDSRSPVTIDHCGEYPVVQHSIADKESEFSLKYRCNKYYKYVGPEAVTCYSDGTWSELPVCKDAFCVLNPGQYVQNYVRLSAVEFIQEREIKQFRCTGYYLTSVAYCINGRITFSQCCHQHDHYYGYCGIHRE